VKTPTATIKSTRPTTRTITAPIVQLIEHPGSRSIEIADALGVPPTNVRTLLSALKREGEVTNTSQRWYLSEHHR
jgi:DNA-binding IclR family transcriptional regulator